MDNGIAGTWLLFLTILLVPICAREFRNSAQLMLAYWFVIVLHQAVAFTNVFWFVTISLSPDAISFHENAITLAQSGSFTFSFSCGDCNFENMLGFAYWIFGPSLMLGQQLAILAFSISCVALVKIHCQLELTRHKVYILLAFGALPTMFMIGSSPMRESYQIMFFMWAVYFGLKMHIKGGVNRYLFFMIMSALGMAVLHHALLVYALFLVVLFLLWTPRPISRLERVKKLRLISVLAMPAVILSIQLILPKDQPISLAVSGNIDLLEAAVNYRANSPVERATYGIAIDLSSSFRAIYSGLVLYIHYLFAPFPWQIKNALDIYASIESILRLVLICFALKNWRNAYGTKRRLLGLMLIILFSMTFLWAIGTTNYGTAIRHNMLTWGILVVTGLPLLMETLNRALLGLYTQTLALFRTD
jgi:hypothetical protein